MNLRLIELFAGIGSQAKALTNLGIDFEHWFVCEFDKYAIASYNAIHNTNFNTSDVTKITANDLNIVETNKYTYLLTYSFPCQDLSLAGKQAGMEKNSGTRSGLLWEVERLLNECDELPQILLMENVPQVHGTKNKEHFDKWIEYLESKGYKNYWQDLNAKNYGIPQNRNRCFMVSVLDNKPFEFPEPFELNLRLRDMLEQNVDEKYYLSSKMVNYITADNEKWTGNNNHAIVNKSIASTLNTGEGQRRCDASNYICDELPENFDLKEILLIREATKKGYAEATEGDGVYINRPHQKRGCVQKDMIPTIKTSPNDVGVVIKDNRNMKERLCDELLEKGLVKENDVIRHSYTSSRMKGEMKDIQENNISPTLDTRCDCLGVVVKGEINVIGNYSPSGHDTSRIVHPDGIAPTVKENHGTVTATVVQPLRIRKLTPKECYRLMGFSDIDFDKASQVVSNAQLYKQAGNSIVVNVLEQIFKELFVKDVSSWLDKLLEVS